MRQSNRRENRSKGPLQATGHLRLRPTPLRLRPRPYGHDESSAGSFKKFPVTEPSGGRDMGPTEEHNRLVQSRDDATPWKKWGPYLSERQWGTVREDYSEGGDAWSYFSHEQSRSRSYRWGEDGLGGISDENQYLCFAL